MAGPRPILIAGLVVAGSLLARPAHAAPETSVDVRFVEPECYTDAFNRFGSSLTRSATLAEIRRIIEDLARRALPPGDRLVVDILDIDLAGYEEAGANFPYGLRVVRDFTAPAFRLRYVLSSRGQRVVAGEERVTDVNFLMGSGRGRTGSFAYERDLLRDWIQRRLVERRPPPP